MYISLYRRYRPQTFSDMVGQSAAVGVLLESLREGSLGHAYLFSGPRGCGKTSAARLVAKSLDCLNRGEDCEPCGVCENCRAIAAGEHLDVIEIDGASNRGIGEIRDLKSHVSLKALSASYKVYIIDEVHMLTDAAFNALLKTLEEPPANVVFLLATTEPHKVPVTIRSRCQHIPFHRITIADTVSRLKHVCSQENIEADEEGIWEIARQADGALRDALSLTEQAVALGRGKLSLESVRELTSGSSRAELEKWVTMLRTDPQGAAAALHSIMARGISSERLCEALFVLFRDLWLFCLWKDKALEALETSSAERDYLAAEAQHWDKDKLQAACMLCSRLLPRTHYGMKGDIFSGLIFMELQNILAGNVQPVPPSRGREPERAAAPQPAARPPREEFSPALPREKRMPESLPPADDFWMPPEEELPPVRQERSAPRRVQEPAPLFAAQPDMIFGNDAPAAFDVAGLCARLGDNEFSRLVGNLSSDWLPIAAALLNAELSRRDGTLEVAFERQMPAKNFLSIPHNRKTLTCAAAKLWGIESGEAQPQPQHVSEPDEPAPEKPSAAAAEAEENEPTAAQSLTSHVLRLAGAEVLYVKSVHANEDESEGNE
ncbi:DNA polymerase III subunit gamma/tau [Cloacibacillus porcorum]